MKVLGGGGVGELEGWMREGGERDGWNEGGWGGCGWEGRCVATGFRLVGEKILILLETFGDIRLCQFDKKLFERREASSSRSDINCHPSSH